MGTETGYLRRAHREAIKKAYPDALIVSQPASAETGPGRTDFYVVVFGRFVGLEIKTSMGRATPRQLATIQRIHRAGGWAGVVRHPDQSLALIEHALQGGSVWSNLFDDETPPEVKVDEPRLDEIRAFKEPQIEAAVNNNGAAMGGDGVAQDPPADYPFAVIVERLDRIVARQGILMGYMMRIAAESGISLEEPSSPRVPAAAPEEPPKTQRRARRK